MLIIAILSFISIVALCIMPRQGHANAGGVKTVTAINRQQKMYEAANSISVMLFSDNFELNEIGPKALFTIGTAIEADFVELWKNQPSERGMLCNQICWWEEESRNTHSFAVQSLSYDSFFTGWYEELYKGNTVFVSKAGASPKILQDMVRHKAESLMVLPVLFKGLLWGFLRVALKKDCPPLNVAEQNIMRSIGLFLVASIQRNDTQLALKASEDRFRDVTQATGEIIWELDSNGFFSYISNRIEAVAGYPATELIGKRWEDISADGYETSITSDFFQAGLAKNVFDNMEHAITAKDGSIIWLRSAAKIIIDSADVAGLRGTSFNYTKARETSLKLEDTLQALLRSNYELEMAVQHAYALAEKANSSNTAKQNFLANISHEIRTPLNSIAGMLYLLEKTDPTGQQHEYIEQIKENSSALVSIVDNILNFTNLQSGEVKSTLTDFSLPQLLHEIATSFHPKLARKNLLSLFSIGKDIPASLRGDMTSLRQILINLLDNAVKFTENGCVALSCSLLQHNSDSVVLQFCVSDTGIGMDTEQQASMLEPFTQKDSSSTRRFGGTGMGLTIAHQLVKLSNGTFTVNSAPGTGTTISFTFALHSGLSSETSRPPAAEHKNLLAVVDDSHCKALFEKALRNSIFNTSFISVDDIDEFIATVRSDKVLIDIIVIRNTLLQSHADTLGALFSSFSCPEPMIVALTPQDCFTQLPDFVTHTITGPVLTFVPPVPVTVAEHVLQPLSVNALPQLSRSKRNSLLAHLDAVIRLLDESDAEGYTLFNKIKGDLDLVDEKNTAQISSLLQLFQFAEAIPLLKKVQEAIRHHED